MLIFKWEELVQLVCYGPCVVSSTCTIQSSLACRNCKTLKKSFTLMLHELLKPAANCFSLEASQVKSKQRSCRCVNRSSPVVLHGCDSSRSP